MRLSVILINRVTKNNALTRDIGAEILVKEAKRDKKHKNCLKSTKFVKIIGNYSLNSENNR